MKRIAISAVVVVPLAAAFWFSPVGPASAGDEASVPDAKEASVSVAKPFKAKKKIRIAAKNSPYGKILFNGKRQAIYIFDKETSRSSKCYGNCASAWPPVLTKGRPKAVGKTRQKLLRTTKRRGGARQVTYAGHPLYYYAHEGPGQVFCHDVFGFGGTWLVVHPNGKAAA